MMESNSPTPAHGSFDTKNAFRKPSGDAANRNYRRRSPAEGSPSPDGNPKQEHISSPNPLREESVRASHHHSRKYDSWEDEWNYGKSHYGRSSDSFRYSDRQSSRGSYGYSRYDKHADGARYREKIYSGTGHESKGDHSREESDGKTKDYQRAGDKYSRDKYDRSNYRSKEKDRETYLEHQKHRDKDSSYDRSGRRHAPYDEVERGTREWEAQSHRGGSRSQRDSSKYRLKEAYKSEQELEHPLEEKRKYDDNEISKDKDHDTRRVGEQFGDEAKESSRKKSKLFGIDRDDKCGNDAERQTTSLKLSHDSKADLGAAKTSGFDVGSTLDAAKVAAMKAAELVNKNLVGGGSLTTDQKKKLLWGGKKSSTVEESGHRWDTAMFSDRERQEKFNKLMSLRLYSCLWQIVGCERRSESGAEIRQPKWRRRAPCREAEGTSAGSRETVHCRPSTKRWTHSWIRSVEIQLAETASFDIFNVFEYLSPMLRGSLLSLVCFRPIWMFFYALMLVTHIRWKFVMRHGRVISMEFLMVVASTSLVLIYENYIDSQMMSLYT